MDTFSALTWRLNSFVIFSLSFATAQPIQCRIFPLLSAGRLAMLVKAMDVVSSGTVASLIRLIIAELMPLMTSVTVQKCCFFKLARLYLKYTGKLFCQCLTYM